MHTRKHTAHRIFQTNWTSIGFGQMPNKRFNIFIHYFSNFLTLFCIFYFLNFNFNFDIKNTQLLLVTIIVTRIYFVWISCVHTDTGTNLIYTLYLINMHYKNVMIIRSFKKNSFNFLSKNMWQKSRIIKFLEELKKNFSLFLSFLYINWKMK